MTAELMILGSNDEQTTCDRCGRVELRGTVILGTADRVEVGRYGSTCAGYMLNPAGGRRGVITLARKIEATRRDRIYWALRDARRALTSGPDEWDGDTPPRWLRAVQIVTGLERDTLLHRADEVAAVADIRAKAREIRRKVRAAA